MPRYTVIKRIINDYAVEVEASSPEEARRKAQDNEHEPGELTSEYNDGEDYRPEKWLAYTPDTKPSRWSLINGKAAQVGDTLMIDPADACSFFVCRRYDNKAWMSPTTNPNHLLEVKHDQNYYRKDR